MGTALMSYLVLSLAGAVLHNHPAHLWPFDRIEKAHFHYHDCRDCEKPGKRGHHDKEDRPDCPVCHFNAVVSGAIIVEILFVSVALLCLCAVFFKYSNFLPSSAYFPLYLRAPPA
jgi:hypothetical protein